MEVNKILVINPGSVSTKIAVYQGIKELFKQTVKHDTGTLQSFKTIMDQYEFRLKTIISELENNGFALDKFDIIVGRGGLLKPLEGGVWRINKKMIKDLRNATAEHASNLGAIIAYNIAEKAGKKPAYIVDPVVVDELDEVARISGMPEIPRKSMFHALNQKAVARQAAKKLGKLYKDSNLVIAHMGGGITVGTHKNGRVVDVNNGLYGEGPMSPERSGSVPLEPLVKMCFSGKYTENEIIKKIHGKGGLFAYFGTADATLIEEKIKRGNKKYKLVYEAMAYQIAKEIGAMATVLKGKIDAIILTGGLAYDFSLVKAIQSKVGFLGKILVYPGENEMEALRDGALRVLNHECKVKQYK